MRGNCIAVIEWAIVHWQCAAIFMSNASFLDTVDLSQLFIRSTKVHIPAIACKQQPVAGSYFDGPPLLD